MPAVAVVDFEYSQTCSMSEQTSVCESYTKEGNMRHHGTAITKTGIRHIGIMAKVGVAIAAISTATLLVFGYGAGVSPSALAYF